MITDRCADLSAHMDMTTLTKAFSLLSAYQILAIDIVGRGVRCNCNHLHHVCTNASAHTLYIPAPSFSLSIAVQILIAEPLDKWLKKRYNTTTLMG